MKDDSPGQWPPKTVPFKTGPVLTGMRFDWQAGNEEDWAPEPEPARRPAGPSRRRPILLAVLLLAMAGAIIFYFYREATRRIDATEQAITRDILASHELVIQAGRSGDAELLRTVLSGADEEWGQAQTRRVESGAAAALARFGLQPLDYAGPPEVTLDPDLRSAVLSWPGAFVVTDTTGITRTVLLTQTAVYRRGSNSWLYAPPRDEFWGDLEGYDGDYFYALFPEREQPVMRRLIRDLDVLLGRLCSRHVCPDGYRLRLLFSTDLASFDDVDGRSLLGASRTITLPSPTLAGLPADGAGYEALRRGYGVLVTTAALAHVAAHASDAAMGSHSDNILRQHTSFLLAWVHREQHLMGLRSWPLDAEAYDRLLLQLPPLPELALGLRVRGRDPGELTFAEWAPLYAYAEYLEELYSPQLAAYPEQAALSAWASAAQLQQGGLSDEWLLALVRFIYESSRSGQLEAPPVPLPDAVLALSCTAESGATALRRYDLATAGWQTLYEYPQPDRNNPSYSYARPLGMGGELLIVTIRPTVSENDAVPPAVSRELAIPSRGITVTLQSGSVWDSLDPLGRYLLLAAESAGEYEPILVNLRDCGESACPITPAPGLIYWSPDGAATLVAGTSQERVLYVGDGDAANLQEVTKARVVTWLDAFRPAYVVTWLDRSHYAYVTESAAAATLVVRALADQDELLRVSLADLWLLAGLPSPAESAGPTAYQLIPHPRDGRQLLVRAGSTGPATTGNGDLFLVALSDDWSAVSSSRHIGADNLWADFSGSGRWLTLASWIDRLEGFDVVIELLDLTAAVAGAAAVQTVPTHLQAGVWAPSGDWLPLSAESYLLLYNPSFGYTHFLPFEDESCSFSSWLASPSAESRQ